MARYIIEEDLAKAILTYLQGRPYGEVHGLVKLLQTIEVLAEEPPKKEEKKGA